jgi:hypothetical protein
LNSVQNSGGNDNSYKPSIPTQYSILNFRSFGLPD